MDPLRISVESVDGRNLLFGHEETDIERILQRPRFDTQMPGGDGKASFVVARPRMLSALDAQLLNATRFFGGGGRVAHGGRVADVPHIGANEIEFSIEGWSAHLGDDETFREIFVDRDLSGWRGSSADRRRTFDATFRFFDPELNLDATENVPALVTSFAQPWVKFPECDAFYDANGIDIGSVYYEWVKSASIVLPDANWDFDVALAAGDDSALGGASQFAALTEAASGSGTLTASIAGKVFAFVYLYYNAAAVGAAPGTQYLVYWNRLAVFGRHGLTKRSSAPNEGFYASDVIAHALRRSAPLISFTEGDSIEQGTFVIPHLVYKTPTTALQVIEDVTALGGGASLVNDWGVKDRGNGPVFFWKTPGTYGIVWRVRKDDYAEPDDVGPSMAGRARKVLVTYQDTAGAEKTVGWVGSGADTESALLEETDPNHPAVRSGTPLYKHIEAGLTNADGATLIGRLALLEANSDTRQGSVKVTDYVYDQAGNRHPAWAINAGDRIVIEDGDDEGAEHYVLSTSYDDDSASVTANVGTVPNRLPALLQRLIAGNAVGGF